MFLVGGWIGDLIACIKIRYFLPEYLRTLKKKICLPKIRLFSAIFLPLKSEQQRKAKKRIIRFNTYFALF
jgi:hypothetical protein